MLRMLLLFCTVSYVVPCCVLCMFFHFFHVFLQGEPGLPGLPGTLVRIFFSAFPNFVGIIACEEKVEVQGGRISLRDVFKYFWFVLFLKEVLKSKDVWRRHVTGSNEEMLCHNFEGLWSVKIRTWGNESIVSSASNRAIPWQDCVAPDSWFQVAFGTKSLWKL